MLICPKCGHDNQLGRIFCHSCGDKLDLSHIKPPTAGEKNRRQVKRGMARGIRVTLKLCVAGVVLLTMVLLGLAPAVAPVAPTNAELVAVDGKHLELLKLGSGQKPGQVTVTAVELNTYLNQKTFDKPTGSAVLIAPVVRRVSLRDGRVKVALLATAHLGAVCDKALYFGYEGEPAIADGHFVFKPTGVWLGQLPIYPRLPFLLALFEQRVVSLLQDVTGDQPLLDKLSTINVTSDAVEFVKVAPPAKP